MLDSSQIQLEQEILGSLLNNSKLIIRAKERIKAYMFKYKPHMKIYMTILDMVERQMEVDLVTFIGFSKNNIVEMDGVTYISEIGSCCPSDASFDTKLQLLMEGYKKSLYLEMCSNIHENMSIEEIEGELENAKVKVHKCQVKKEIDIASEYNDYMTWLYDDKRNKGIESNLTYIDKYLGNFQKGRLVTVFARSGVGKTTFSIQIASNMALNGANVFYGSAEMSVNQVFNKIAASHLSLSSKSIDEDGILTEQKDSICKFMIRLLENNFYVSTETDIDKFINEIKLYKLQHSLDVVFVDYINKYIDFSDRDIMTNKLGRVSGKLKSLAMEEDICVVLVAQANRVVDKRAGDMAIEKIDASDIQDSARIEQDSDQVIALYRNIKLDDKKYKDKLFKMGKIRYNSTDADENPECMNAVVIKNRHGERGTCALKWQGKYSRICNF